MHCSVQGKAHPAVTHVGQCVHLAALRSPWSEKMKRASTSQVACGSLGDRIRILLYPCSIRQVASSVSIRLSCQISLRLARYQRQRCANPGCIGHRALDLKDVSTVLGWQGVPSRTVVCATSRDMHSFMF
jgi:hypothetical protein